MLDCIRGNIITFRSTGGTILNEFTGNRIEFERVNVLMGFEQGTVGVVEVYFVRPVYVPVLTSGAGVEQTRVDTFTVPKLVQTLRTCQG